MVTPQDAHNGKKKLSLLSLLFLALAFLPLVSAVQIDSGTIIQSVGLNTTLNFTSTYYANIIEVESSFIYFEGFRSTDAGTETVTVNMTNRNMTGIPPYISSSTSTTKTITSTLSQSVNATVIVNVAKCPIGASYQSVNYNYDSCSGGIVIYSLNNIPNGNSNLVLSFAGGTPTLNECDSKSSLISGIASLGNFSNIAPIVVMVTIIIYLIFGYKVYRRSGNPKLQGVENIWNAFISLIMFGSLGAVFALILISNIPC